MNVNQSVTLNTLLEKAKTFMGSKFFSYSAQNNDCQSFVDAITSSNGLSNTQKKDFVLQDTEYLFYDNIKFRKIVNTITDTGAVVSRAKDIVNDVKENPKIIVELP